MPLPPEVSAEPPVLAVSREPAGSVGVPVSVTAWRSVGAHLRLWLVAALGLGLDLGSKEWAFRTLRQGGNRVLLPNILEFHTTLNPGALFGIGAGHTEIFLLASILALILVLWMFAQSPPKRWLTQVALGAILAGALGNMYDRVFVQLVLHGLATPGGTVARYYVQQENGDARWIELREYPPAEAVLPTKLPRIAAESSAHPIGYVRDFIKIPTRWVGGRELWPWVFNVADMLLVGGVAILSLRMLRERHSGTLAHAALDPGVGKT